MSKQHSVKFNFIMNFILTASAFIFPLITYPYASRILGPDGIGRVSFSTSVISYFTMFAMLGIPTYGIRACAKVRDDREELSRTVQEIMILNIIMTTIVYIVFFVMLEKIERFQQEKTLLLISSASILLHTIGVNWLYQGLEEYGYITVRSLIFKVIGLVLLFVFVHTKQDLKAYAVISVITGYGSYIWNLLRLRKMIVLKPLCPYRLKRHLKPVLVFFAMSVATSVYTNLDTVMLGFLNTDLQLGYYNTAVKIKSILVSLITSVGTVLLPRMSYYYEQKEQEKFNRMISKALNVVLIMALPLTLYFVVYARESVLLLSGAEFEAAVPGMRLIMPALIFIGITNVFGMQVMVPTGRERHVLISVVTGAVVDFALNLVLIPGYGAAGAAAATAIAEFAVLLVQAFLLRGMLGQIGKEIHLKYIAAALIVAGACLAVVKTVLSVQFVFLSLLVSAVLFFGVYFLVLWVGKEPEVRELIGPWLKKIEKRSDD